jgi:hypothetical protein
LQKRDWAAIKTKSKPFSPQIIKHKHKTATQYDVVCFVDELLPNLVFAIKNGLIDPVNELSLKLVIV